MATAGTDHASVRLSNTAATMLNALFGQDKSKIRTAMAQIEADIRDPAKVRRIVGRDGVYVAKGHGMRVVFKRENEAAVITSVATADG